MIRQFVASLALALAAAVGALISPPAGAATYVYVGSAASNDVRVFRFNNDTGELTPVESQPLGGPAAAGASTPMSVSQDKRFLFVGVRSQPYRVVTFSINKADGKLTRVGEGPLAHSMAYIYADKTGRWLLSASYPGHKLTVNPIGQDGAVGPIKQTIEDVPNAHAIQTDAANKFALAPSLGSDTVRQYSFDAGSGTLTANDPPSVKVGEKDGPRHFVFHPDGKHVYLLCELTATAFVYDYDPAKGLLTEKQKLVYKMPGYERYVWGADTQITPDGKYLYMTERGTSTVAAFSIDPASGKLALVEYVPTETQPRAIAIDPRGKFLLAVGQLSHGMTAYAIDPASGRLRALARYKMGDNPNWIEILDLQ